MKPITTQLLVALTAAAVLATSSPGFLRAADPATAASQKRQAVTFGAADAQRVTDKLQQAAAKSPRTKPAQPEIRDVALLKGGRLSGFLVDAQGRALPEQAIIVRRGRRVLGRTTTGANGEFTFSDLKGGIYEVVSAQGRQVFRVWSTGTAPKSARGTALIVARSRVVRGQFGDMGFATLLNIGDIGAIAGMGTASTVATVGVIAGITVGTVVAVEAADDDDPPPAMMGGGMMSN